MSMEYKEMRIPQEILDKLRESAEKATENPASAQPLTLGEAGVYDWLTKLSKEEGWRPVWMAFNFPDMVLERETN